ncbi:hypothetical protein [Nocardia farcinica]|uniref:hypothetical protein n=1 Tax=Nocardia farcinica TaxID=37329 RepID=UPI002457A1ED|nr:hypothetical protein [Nocardia farcinica]
MRWWGGGGGGAGPRPRPPPPGPPPRGPGRDFLKRVMAVLDRDLRVAAILGGASLDDVVALMAENTN